MTTLFDALGHVEGEALDLYCAGRLPSRAQEQIRRHLAVCPACQQAADQENLLRAALIDNRDSFAEKETPGPSRSIFRGLIPVPLAAAAGVLVTALGSAPFLIPVSGLQEVPLSALRGPESESGFESGRPLRLRLDLTGLPETPPMSVEVVDRRSLRVASGVPRREDDRAIFEIRQSLPPGQYWVRLQAANELMREYSLPLR